MKMSDLLATFAVGCLAALSIPTIAAADMPVAPDAYKAPAITPELQIEAARGIIERTTPTLAKVFVLETIPKEDGLDVFEIDGKGANVVLRGSSGVALASAYNWYLKHYLNCHLSWCGDQLALPDFFPIPKKVFRRKCPHEYRVYFNYCTLCYSAAWWDWKRWRREIDFMAMNGINMPLSVTGLEAVWYNTLLKFGFTAAEARAYLVGPAYFAWQWMPNIQSHGGPLPKEWIESHAALGRKILTAQRALGMTPIQQGFSGCVPREFMKKFPDAAIAQEKKWCNFEGTAQLDPLDPLFKKFGTAFLEEEIRLFGTSHVYAADPFHEGHPPKPGKEYLQKVGTAIYDLMSRVDPKALWAMQAWSIRKDIACSAPKGKLLVLDLGGSKYGKSDNFWGYPFIKGQLHNFGGRINIHGDLRSLADNPFAKAVKKVPNACGTGLFMEGIIQNPVFYDLYFDVIWRDEAVEILPWLKDYARRRYGAPSENAAKAWKLLLEGPYRRGTNGVESSSIIAARPALDVKKSGPNAGFKMPYKPKNLVKALELLLADSDRLAASDAYRYDVVDIARQVLSNLGQPINKKAAAAFKAKDKKQFAAESARFLGLLGDVDTLLASRPEFLFGKWTADARNWGADDKAKAYYEWNASMLVTIWGPENAPTIFDYSWREWSGLISQYYQPRANEFYDQLADWEQQFIHKHHPLSAKPKGDEIELAKSLLKKYKQTP